MSENNTGQVSQPMSEARPKKKRSVKKIVGYVVLAFVVVIVGVTLLANSATKEPVKVSNQFLNAIQAGNASEAYGFFSSEAKAAVPSDKFEGVVAQVGSILNTEEKMTNKSVKAETGSASTAEVTYEIKGTDGGTYNIIVNLIKEGDIWKVQNFDSKLKS
ncbi:MAG: DUF4878 domain-containing protein [Candidatus Nanopelagicaceae bacterium]|nr:DUF4878 domain-containing protein [Candidatus Nanopelagicaceae bacterium]